jgi:hypothetical protein
MKTKTPAPKWREAAARKAADPRDGRSRDERLAALHRLTRPSTPRVPAT